MTALDPELQNTLQKVLSTIHYDVCDTRLSELLSRAPYWSDIDTSTLCIALNVPIKHHAENIAQQVYAALVSEGAELEGVVIEQAILAVPTANFSGQVAGVKNIIAVASGKGGVGKSTTAVNLALALANMGARVGVLDADIYGPSQTHMLGLQGQRPEVHEGKHIQPLRQYGIQVMSMGNMVTDKTPMIWRGPMVSGALQQLLMNTQWDDVDYLVVDMPPGTGDIPLTLSQRVPVSGAVIVTTPQDIALLDAKKGIEMFRKVNIPVVGVVENMAVHVCSECGHEEHIFGQAGGAQLAETYNVKVLAQLPLALAIREHSDSGKPVAVDNADKVIAHAYTTMATRVAAAVAAMSKQGNSIPTISIVDEE